MEAKALPNLPNQPPVEAYELRKQKQPELITLTLADFSAMTLEFKDEN